MRQRSIALLTALAAVIILSNAPATAQMFNVSVHVISHNDSALPMYDSESDARSHCHGSSVVWLNTDSRVFHPKGDAWYANTKHGAYVCRNDAVARHYRETGIVKIGLSR